MKDFDQVDSYEEADHLLALARTERNLLHAAKHVAELRVKAHKLRAELYQLKALQAAKRFNNAELQVGKVSYHVKSYGFYRYPTVNAALQKYGRDSSRYGRDSSKSHQSCLYYSELTIKPLKSRQSQTRSASLLWRPIHAASKCKTPAMKVNLRLRFNTV